MHMTDSQLSSLQTDLANNTASVMYQGSSVQIKNLPHNSDAAGIAAVWYNNTFDPDFWVWKSTLDSEAYLKALDWTEVDNIAAAKARIFEWMTGGLVKPLHPFDANQRAGLLQAFTAAAAPNTRSALIVIARRLCTKFEKLFTTGTGSTGSPGDLAMDKNNQPLEGPLNGTHVERAWDFQ